VVEVAGSWPPLAFVSLGAQARRAGWNARVYDAMTLRHDYTDIAKTLREETFDVFATTAITPTFPDAARMCALAKEINPGCVTLIGGVHPTFMAREILTDDDKAIDYVIAGEGELGLHAFLADFDDAERRHEAPNLVFRNGGDVQANRREPFIADLDALPAAWDLLDWDLYEYYVIPDSRLGSVSTSRGCNFGCTFCSQQRFWNRSWRGRRPAAVVEEMSSLHREIGVNVFLFTDEYPTKDADRWEELLDRLIAADLDSYVLMETRVEDIVRDEAILPKYRRAGIVHVYVGAEATDQETLDSINKQLDVALSRQAIDLIAAHGMISETSFVLGFPEETKESIEETLRVARAFNPDFAHFLAITPWPYAEFYREVAEYIEVHDYSQYNLIEPILRPRAMSLREIDLAIIDCYRRFYMPKMISFRKISDPFRRDYLLRSMKLIMHSSFLIGKFAKLGINPRAMMDDVLHGKRKESV
jgi:anaerobic magnesium-protoporphyrin IX monomethyl ester cyclase